MLKDIDCINKYTAQKLKNAGLDSVGKIIECDDDVELWGRSGIQREKCDKILTSIWESEDIVMDADIGFDEKQISKNIFENTPVNIPIIDDKNKIKPENIIQLTASDSINLQNIGCSLFARITSNTPKDALNISVMNTSELTKEEFKRYIRSTTDYKLNWMEINNESEQLKSIKKDINDIDILFITDIAKFKRPKYNGLEDLSNRNKQLTDYVDYLRKLMYEHECIVFILNQYTGQNAWGGESLLNYIDMHIHATKENKELNYLKIHNQSSKINYKQNDYSIYFPK